MSEINAQTLSMAIQAIDFKINHLEAELEALPNDQGAELEDLLLCYTKAAEALEAKYREIYSSATNLSPYEKLVRR